MAAPGASKREAPRAAVVGGAAGILAVVVGLSGVVAATLVAPWFSWTGNALSDLGAPGRQTAALFTFAIVAAGALYLEFVRSLWQSSTAWSRGGRAGLGMLGGGALFLIGVGAVPTGYFPHFWLSVGYFFLYPPGVILFGAAERTAHKGLLPASLVLAATALAFGVLQFTPLFSSQAIPELVLSASMGAWTMVVGVWMIRGEIQPAVPAPA